MSGTEGIEVEEDQTTRANCLSAPVDHIIDTDADLMEKEILKAKRTITTIDTDTSLEAPAEEGPRSIISANKECFPRLINYYLICFRHGSHYELVDSEAQWKEVQRRQAEGGTGVHQATVINNKDRRSGYMNSGMETESEMSYHHKRKQKKHR